MPNQFTDTSGWISTQTLAVTNGVYSVGDVVGGLITIPLCASSAGRSSVLQSIVLSGVVNLAYELWYFASDIATPAADNAVFTLVAADIAKCKGVLPVALTDWYNSTAAAFMAANKNNVGMRFNPVATTLYAYMKATVVTSPGTTVMTITHAGQYLD